MTARIPDGGASRLLALPALLALLALSGTAACGGTTLNQAGRSSLHPAIRSPSPPAATTPPPSPAPASPSLAATHAPPPVVTPPDRAPSSSPVARVGSAPTSPGPLPACAANLAGELATTAGAGQLVTVDDASYGSTVATLTLWQRSGSCWSVAYGPWASRVGANGVSDHHREGDNTTPTGIYGIGSVLYGIAGTPGVRYRYHQLACGDWWDEDPASPTYNTFQHVACGTPPPFHGASEALWTETTAYQHFAVIDYNTGPIVAGAGSGVFIHDDVGGPTAGCVSLPAAELDTFLRWLNPVLSPRVVIGTDAEIRRF